MTLLLLFMQLTRDLFAIAEFLLVYRTIKQIFHDDFDFVRNTCPSVMPFCDVISNVHSHVTQHCILSTWLTACAFSLSCCHNGNRNDSSILSFTGMHTVSGTVLLGAIMKRKRLCKLYLR